MDVTNKSYRSIMLIPEINTYIIGSHLIESLSKNGHTIKCIARNKQKAGSLLPMTVEVIPGDLNDPICWQKILENIEIVYHLAGVTRAKSVNDYYRGNFSATKQIVEACVDHGANLRRFVYVSSLAAVGPSVTGQSVSENIGYHPVSDYGKSKMMGELEVLHASGRLPVTILRPSAVYGPRDQDMFEYIRLIQKGIKPLIGFGKKYLNLIYSEDLVRGTLLAAENPRAVGEIYFLGSEQSYTTEEIGDTIANIVHARPIPIHLPHAVVYSIGATAQLAGKLTGKAIFFNIQKARESVQKAWVCSVTKAYSQLGFQPHYSLLEGMQKTYDWYREQKWL